VGTIYCVCGRGSSVAVSMRTSCSCEKRAEQPSLQTFGGRKKRESIGRVSGWLHQGKGKKKMRVGGVEGGCRKKKKEGRGSKRRRRLNKDVDQFFREKKAAERCVDRPQEGRTIGGLKS